MANGSRGMFRNVQIHLDGRMLFALLLLLGYYLLINKMASRALPAENVELVKDALLVLGPAIGVAVGSIFRSNVSDDTKTQALSDAATNATAGLAAAAAPAANGAGSDSQAGTERAVRDGIRDAVDKGALTGLRERTDEELPEYAR